MSDSNFYTIETKREKQLTVSVLINCLKKLLVGRGGGAKISITTAFYFAKFSVWLKEFYIILKWDVLKVFCVA